MKRRGNFAPAGRRGIYCVPAAQVKVICCIGPHATFTFLSVKPKRLPAWCPRDRVARSPAWKNLYQELDIHAENSYADRYGRLGDLRKKEVFMNSSRAWDREHPPDGAFCPTTWSLGVLARSRKLRIETLESRVALSAVVGQYVLYGHSAFDTDAGCGDGVPDLIIGPDGVTLDTDDVPILGYDLRSAAGIFTGQPADNAGAWGTDTDTLINSVMVIEFNGTHLLGDVIGREWAGIDLPADLTFSYFTPGNPQSLTGTISLADAAVAPDKVALLPGGVATADNYTNYSRGINALAIDVQDLADPEALDAASVGQYLTFRVGNDGEPGNWAPAPAIKDVAVWHGRGTGGSDRVLVAWEDNAIENQWLEVTVLPNAQTGLDDPYVFYFGNAVAETGNSAADARVTVADLLLTRNNLRGVLDPAGIDDPYDFNRDRRVNATDVLLARNNQSDFSSVLQLIDLSSPQGPQPTLPPDVAWLSEYGENHTEDRPSEKSDSLTKAADALLAVYLI